MYSVSLDCYSKIHYWKAYKQHKFILIVLEAGKSKNKVLEDSVSYEASRLQTVNFSLRSHMFERASEGIFYEGINSMYEDRVLMT